MLQVLWMDAGVASVGIAAAGRTARGGKLLRGYRNRLVVALGTTSMVLAAIVVPAVPAAASKAKLPSKLLLLEQRMKGLSINSERVALDAVVRRSASDGRRVVEKGSRVTEAVEASHSPLLARLKIHPPAKATVEDRQVGHEAFVQSPGIARKDGGRPWVQINLDEPGTTGGEGFASIIGNGPGSLVGVLAKDIAKASLAKEIGPATVLGHRTTEFFLTISTTQVTVAAISSRHGHAAKSTTGKTVRRRIELKLRVFFAPDGLPLRTDVEYPLGRGRRLYEQQTILATEVPLSVQAPSPSETITAAEAAKLEGAPHIFSAAR